MMESFLITPPGNVVVLSAHSLGLSPPYEVVESQYTNQARHALANNRTSNVLSTKAGLQDVKARWRIDMQKTQKMKLTMKAKTEMDVQTRLCL